MKYLDVAVFSYFLLFILGILLFQLAIRKLPVEARTHYLEFRFKQRKWYPIVLLFGAVGFIAMKLLGVQYFTILLSIATIGVIGLFAYLHKQQNAFFEEFTYPSQFKQAMSINFIVDLLRQIAFIIILFYVVKDFFI